MRRPAPARTVAPDPLRDAAFDLLAAVLDRHRPLEEALDALPPLDARDRAGAHRLAATVLRRQGTLDEVVDGFLDRAPPDPVRRVLRIGAAQALLLGTPPHAAVATAVALARRRGLDRFAGLANAVLRRVAEAGAMALDGLFAPRLDTPDWLWRSWGAEAAAIAAAHQSEAPLDLTLVDGATPPPGSVALPTGGARLPPGTPVRDLPGYSEGAFWVQDAAAALPVRLLRPRRGDAVIDLCAAPGGKTAQLAAAGATVTAVERDPARLERLSGNLSRLRLPADLVRADALDWRPAAPADAVLLDAPCSATGTIRRHPDILRLRRPGDPGRRAGLQDRLLDAACAMLRPGGVLVYAVCSLQPEEGEDRIETALARLPLRRDPVAAAELPGLSEAVTASGDVRTHPGLWPELGGLDGFFIARMRRT